MITVLLLCGFMAVGIWSHRKGTAPLILVVTILLTWGWLATHGWRYVG